MIETKARRGRPIGTGIDDSDRIERLAELLKTQPDLKPTTAIRVMGFSDPSTIRRLRDKYKACHSAGSNCTSSNPAAANTPGTLRTPRTVPAAVIAGTPQLMR
jgi:hypothetical protein